MKRLLVAIAAIAAVVIAACGGGEQAVEITSATQIVRFGSTPQVEIEPLRLNRPLEQGGRFLDLISRIPSTAENRRSLWINDFIPLWEAWRALGASRPVHEDGPGAVDDFFDDLAVNRTGNSLFARPRMPSPRISGFDVIGGIVNTFDFVGFDQRHVDGSAIAGPSGNPVEIVVGDYHPERTAEALAACGECRPHEVVDYSGLEYYSWGEDLIGDLDDHFAPPLFDHAGRGGRIAMADGVAMRALTTARMESLLDASVNAVPTVDEDPDFALASAAHNAAGTYSAWFSNLPFDVEDGARMAINFDSNLRLGSTIETLLTAEPLQAYDLISFGWGVDTAVPYGVLVLIHGDNATALRNADLLAERFRSALVPDGGEAWSSLIDRAEVGVEGRAVIAKLFPHPDQALFTVNHFQFAYGLAVYE
ncbi:MAG: hypothetical protein IH961_03675 [Chloroflexi bacterium]|nr:hypothetical protein [Chloroflexota bacterium]